MKTKMTEGKKTIMALEPSFVAERIYEGVSRRDQFICDPYPIYAFTGVMKALPATVFVTINELLMKTKEKRDLFVCFGSIIIWIHYKYIQFYATSPSGGTIRSTSCSSV